MVVTYVGKSGISVACAELGRSGHRPWPRAWLHPVPLPCTPRSASPLPHPRPARGGSTVLPELVRGAHRLSCRESFILPTGQGAPCGWEPSVQVTDVSPEPSTAPSALCAQQALGGSSRPPGWSSAHPRPPGAAVPSGPGSPLAAATVFATPPTRGRP